MHFEAAWLDDCFLPSTLSLQIKFLSDSLATEGNSDPVFGQPLIRKLFHLVTQDSCAVTGVTALDILIGQAKTNSDNFLSLVKGQSILDSFELMASPVLGQNVYTDLWAEKWADLYLLCHCRQGPCHERLEHWRKVMEKYRLPALQVLFSLQYKSCCIRRHAGLFPKTCLDYKTCHTIYSKTRLKYRTQQPSVDVTMTSSLLSSKMKRFKTRGQY